MPSRRDFLFSASLTGFAAFVGRATFAQNPAGAALVSVGSEKLATMPLDFTGLSYEIIQLYNPTFFSASNVKLVQAFRRLSPHGVLRLGGNLSDVSRWNGNSGDFNTPKQTAAIQKGKLFWEWKLSDATVRVDRDGAITPASIEGLRTFLDATGWKLIYGLNFGSGSVERAADEAACVAAEIGDRLIALQIGNESDFYGGNHLFRERPWGFSQYYESFQNLSAAIRKRVPSVRVAGPDTASNMGWVEQFGEAQKALPSSNRAPLLTSHFYAMGPASNPAMNADRLLSPNTKLLDQIDVAKKATLDSGGIPFRMAEGNSCYGGGKPGVSDSFCSALWGADYMLQLAAAGYAGVNLHGGGDGYYTPIDSLDASAPIIRPLYLGMQLAERFAGLTFLKTELNTSTNVTAYHACNAHTFRQALINKSDQPVQISFGADIPRSRPDCYLLSAPSLSSQEAVTFAPAPSAQSGKLTLQPHSAILQSWTI